MKRNPDHNDNTEKGGAKMRLENKKLKEKNQKQKNTKQQTTKKQNEKQFHQSPKCMSQISFYRIQMFWFTK
jgi:hypothetical protein